MTTRRGLRQPQQLTCALTTQQQESEALINDTSHRASVRRCRSNAGGHAGIRHGRGHQRPPETGKSFLGLLACASGQKLVEAITTARPAPSLEPILQKSLNRPRPLCMVSMRITMGKRRQHRLYLSLATQNSRKPSCSQAEISRMQALPLWLGAMTTVPCLLGECPERHPALSTGTLAGRKRGVVPCVWPVWLPLCPTTLALASSRPQPRL